MGKCYTRKGNIISTLIAIAFFSIGLSIGLIGFYDYIKVGDDKYKEDNKNPELIPLTIQDPTTIFVTAPSNIQEMIIIFNSTDVFSANNPITATIYVIVNNSSKLDRITAIDLTSSSDISAITESNINDTIKNFEKNKGHFINLDKATKNLLLVSPDNSYTTITKNRIFSGNWTFTLKSEAQLIFLFLEIKDDKILNEYQTTKDSPFIIYPSTAKLQADTNRNILKQNIESAQTNYHVEGLTYVIIGLVFVALGFEIPIHRWLT